ncbi:MAG: M56 family metallopeptidase [Prevotella sp.]
MMYYALKSALLLTLLYGGFSALLSRETFHCFNRITLLGIVLLSLVLPAVHITTSTPAPIVLEQYWEEKAMAEEQVPAVEESPAHTTVVSVTPQASADNPLKEKDFWESLYIIGIAVALVRFIHRSILLTRSLQGGLRISDKQGNTVIIKDGEFPPFSFMHWICISVGDYERHRRSILTHEQAHARLGHSWDALLLELLQVVQWFNPFAWLLGRELRAVHEYEADEAVICQGTDAKQYQQLLVIKAVGNRLQPFANTLNRGSLKQRINMMQQQKSNRWRMLRATFAVPMAALALVAFATPEVKTDEVQQAVLSDESKPLVEYKTHEKWGKGYRDYYRVNLGEGVWIESNGASHIEEKFFTYSFDNTNNAKVPRKTTMMLNGVPFDQNSLPKLTSKDLKKIEIKNAENAMLASDANGKALSVKGQQITVNLITTPVTIPADIEGNVPRVQTLLLPGKGELYIKNGKATPGDWMHSSITDWEKTSYNYSVRNEFEKSKTKPGFKCYIYASTETSERDISRAEALMRELGIKNYEVVRNLPKKHYTDSELRQWAHDQKAKGTAYDKLFDAMAPNHMDCADVHRQWHIVKSVYGRK